MAVGLLSAVALAASLSACGGAMGEAADQDQALKIGFIAPMTGPVTQEATAMKRGFDLAIEKINAEGGVLGVPVEVVEVDDQADVAKSTQLAQRLIDQDGVNYLFGTISSDTTAAVAQVADSAKVPFSAAILGDDGFCSPYFFPFGEPNASMLNGLIPHMMETEGMKVALIGNDYSFPRSYLRDARILIEEAGGEVVLEEYSPLGTADWQPVISKINASEPDWILNAVVGSDAIALVSQADQAGVLDNYGFSGMTLIADFWPGFGDRAEGLTLVGRYSDQMENEANRAFVEAYRESYGDDPIASVTANAYEGVQLIARIVEELGSTDSEGIVEALKNAKVEDAVFGSGSFNEDRFFMTETSLLEIQAGGKYVVLETFAPDIAGIVPQC